MAIGLIAQGYACRHPRPGDRATLVGSRRSMVVKLLTPRRFSSLLPAYGQYIQEIHVLSREDADVSKTF